jgi:uncharacterized protein
MEKPSKKTLVLGASDNPARYSFLAVNNLRNHGHPVVAIGRKKTAIADITVDTESKPLSDIDTVTLYLNPDHQRDYIDYIVSLHPKRVVFNPGTENEELQQRLEKEKIPYIEACTLVLLSTGQY